MKFLKLAIVCSLMLASVCTASAAKKEKIVVSPFHDIHFTCAGGYMFAVSRSGDIAQVFEKGMYPYYSSVPMKCREVEDK